MIRTILYLLLPMFTAAQPGSTNYTDLVYRGQFPGNINITPGSGYIIVSPSDSIYVSTDKPVITDEDLPMELGIAIASNEPGKITHLKFYCVSAGNYTVSIWSITGSIFLSKNIAAKIGWNRLKLDIPFEVAAGDRYIISYLTKLKMGHTKNYPLKSSTNITQLSSLYSYGHVAPKTLTNDGYFVDVVFEPDIEVVKPLVVNSGKDTSYRLPKDTLITVKGIVTGDSSYYEWEIIDSSGTCTVSGLNTLNPTIKTKEPCTVLFSLFGGDKWGNHLGSITQINILPDLKTVAIELYIDGTYRIVNEDNFFLMKNKTQ